MSLGWPLAPLSEPQDPYNLRAVDPKVAGIIQVLEMKGQKLGFLGDSNFKDLSFSYVARNENLLKYFYEPEHIVGTKQKPPVQAATVQKPTARKAPVQAAPVQRPPVQKSPVPALAVIVQTSAAKPPVAPPAPEPMEQEGVDLSVDTGFPSLGASANPDLSPVEDPWIKPSTPQKKTLTQKDPAVPPEANASGEVVNSPKRSLSPHTGSLSPDEKRPKLSASLTNQLQEHDRLGAQSIDLLRASATFPSPADYEKELLATSLTSWLARNPGVADDQDSPNTYDPRPTPESVGLDATFTNLGRSFQFMADNMGPTLARGIAQAQARNTHLMNTLITQGQEISDLTRVKDARISELEANNSVLTTNISELEATNSALTTSVSELEAALKKQQASSLEVLLGRSDLKSKMENVEARNVKSLTKIVQIESENEELKETLRTFSLRNQTLLDVNKDLSKETHDMKGAFDSTLRELAILKTRTQSQEPPGSAPASASSSATFAAAAVTPGQADTDQMRRIMVSHGLQLTPVDALVPDHWVIFRHAGAVIGFCPKVTDGDLTSQNWKAYLDQLKTCLNLWGDEWPAGKLGTTPPFLSLLATALSRGKWPTEDEWSLIEAARETGKTLTLFDPRQSSMSPFLSGQSSHQPLTSMSSLYVSSTPYQDAPTLTYPPPHTSDANTPASARLTITSSPIRNTNIAQQMLASLDFDLGLTSEGQAPPPGNPPEIPRVLPRTISPILIKKEPLPQMDMEVEDVEGERTAAPSSNSSSSSVSGEYDLLGQSKPQSPEYFLNSDSLPLGQQARSRASSPMSVPSPSLLDTPPGSPIP
jgi:hypothetical protein